jgi:predicted GH43/DUF377 family glycosyl hydrolase
MFVVHRDPRNPLLTPRREDPWQALAAFNPSVVKDGSGLRLYYRALANPAALIAPFAPESTIGMAVSDDGKTFHTPRQVLVPRESWEAFGCEDPRATVIDGVTYLSYTALGGYPYTAENIRVAIAVSHDGEDFTERHLATPFNAKAFALFPEKVGDKYAALLSVNTDCPPTRLCLALADRISDFWSPEYWAAWYEDLDAHALSLVRSNVDHVEVGAIPLKTEQGWLFIYSYIEGYFGNERVFGVEAALLDLENPCLVTGRTYSFLVPEEIYEQYGVEPEIVFPTSVLLRDDGMLDLYYGAADTTVARASLRLADLLDTLNPDTSPVFVRAPGNPIIQPRPENPFEARATFNPAAIDLGGSVHILYRTMSKDNTSMIGYARSDDGITIDERLSVPVYEPRAEFEMKRGDPNGNSGCEDPRVVLIDDRIYMTYTAYDGVHAPRGAVTSIHTEDFLAKRFDTWTEPFLVTPDTIDDKDLAFLPEKVDGGFLLYHRIAGRICADILPTLTPGTKVSRCIEIMGPRAGMWDAAKIGIACPPLKVPEGWLFFYHGVSTQNQYRVGVALLDASGTTVLARAADPVFEAVEDYERLGEIPNVVFPCGAVVRDDTILLYYGGGDRVLGVATASLARIRAALTL